MGPQFWSEGVCKLARAAAKGEEECRKTNTHEDLVQGEWS